MWKKPGKMSGIVEDQVEVSRVPLGQLDPPAAADLVAGEDELRQAGRGRTPAPPGRSTGGRSRSAAAATAGWAGSARRACGTRPSGRATGGSLPCVSKGNPQTKKASTRGKICTAFGTTSSDWAAVKPFLISRSTRSRARLDAEAQLDAAAGGHRAHHLLVDQVHAAERLPLHASARGVATRRRTPSPAACRRRRTRPGRGTGPRPPARCRNSISSTMFCGAAASSSPGSTPGPPSRTCRDRGSRGWSSCRSRRSGSGRPSRRPGRGSRRGRRSAARSGVWTIAAVRRGTTCRATPARSPPRRSGGQQFGAGPLRLAAADDVDPGEPREDLLLHGLRARRRPGRASRSG